MEIAEFEERFNGKEDGKVETCYGVSEIRKHFRGVSKQGNKWRARIFHPKLKRDVYLGSYYNPEEAARVVKQKKAELMKMYGSRYSSMRDSQGCKNSYKLLEETSRDIVTTSEFSDQLTDDLKVPRGVRKLKSGRWFVRIAGPLPKSRIRLGTFDSVEEAVRSYHKGKAEFAASRGKANESPIEMYGSRYSRLSDNRGYKSGDKLLQETSRDIVTTSEFSDQLTDDLKVPRGVRKLKSGRWHVRIAGPLPKSRISLGTFDNVEEAVRSYNKGKAELAASREKANKSPIEMYGSRYSRLSNNNIVTTSELSDQLSDDVKVPRGVRKQRSGRWGARIAGPLPNTRIWLGTFDNLEEAVAANLEKGDESPVSGFPTSVLGSDNSNSISINDKAKLEVLVANVPGKLEYSFGESSSMTVSEPENINSSDVSDRSIISKGKEQKIACISDFDEAVSLGFINEYGQLVGIYSELDEQMEFTQLGKDVAESMDGCGL